MSKALRALLFVFCYFAAISSAQADNSVSEAELVAFLNEKGISIISDEESDVTIRYDKERNIWGVHIQGKCKQPNCVCIDCERIITVIETPDGLKISSEVLGG